MDTEMTAAAAAMTTVILEPENLSPMMLSFAMKLCYRNATPHVPEIGADGSDLPHWRIAGCEVAYGHG
jgi:hypothetical protein